MDGGDHLTRPAPGPGRSGVARVVGAAIVAGGRVLAARRTSPPAAAGRWELPGGKVEPGEGAEAALVREVAEELRCTVSVVAWLAPVARIDDRHELVVALARLVGGDPDPVEHDAVRWLAVDELDAVDWLDPDRPFLPEIAGWLARHPAGARGVFFDEGDARVAAAALTADGYHAEVVRERLAGEDDDEDHPWAVLSDAPPLVLELVVERFEDAWLDVEEPPPVRPPTPLDLPRAPRGPRP
ncbi:(deoxy)nucleoside triphosphate pyrophosphohydrolase [Nocardioides sp.]|uniref:(deoxy)nucleoside triphosphate pyrophosphohydrolase n=1 Tax=Nocardioides sp. TaxID=35761 RepID=UPI0035279F36